MAIKVIDYKAAYEELTTKYEEERAKYNTRLTRKACAVVGIVSFILGFLAKAKVF
ncbi:hypothetical protein SDC9_86767 [bioreactor metagenome]|uniref:Uncharacterized protein n=1 Tax=bioreactor metagenome TaxID=1076179 RepID=A0A644ZH51_9ZZZZ